MEEKNTQCQNESSSQTSEKKYNFPEAKTSSMVCHVFRLLPDQDLYNELLSYIEFHKIQAACIITCVGSLKKINIRLANTEACLTLEEKFEIVSLVGNISPEREHLHIGLSDGTGKSFGGHLKDGNIIYTTAEIVLGVFPELKFSKEYCQKSGWEE